MNETPTPPGPPVQTPHVLQLPPSKPQADPGPWREVFVQRLATPESRAAMRRFGEVLDRLSFDEDDQPPPEEGSWIRRDLRAAAVDLRAVLVILEDIRETGGYDAEPADLDLVTRAGTWAECLDTLAREIEAALGELCLEHSEQATGGS